MTGGSGIFRRRFILLTILFIFLWVNNGILFSKFADKNVEPRSISKTSHIFRKYFDDPPHDSGFILFSSTDLSQRHPAYAGIRPLAGAVYNSEFLAGSANYKLIRSFPMTQPSPYHRARSCLSKQARTPWILEFSGVWMDGEGNVLVPERMDGDTVVARHYSLGGGCCERDWKTANTINFRQSQGCRHESAFSLAQNHGCGPWHIFSELLPRLFSFWDTARNIIRERGVLVVCPSIVPLNFLTAIGIPGKFIARPNGICYFDRLFVPEPIIQGQYPRDCLMEASEHVLIDTLLKDVPPPPKNPLVLIIDRAKSRSNRYCRGSRCIANLPQLVENIRRQWPNSVTVRRMVHNETDMVRTSARLFYHATVVVGMHGGGLTNIIYMRRNVNTSVIQIGWRGGISKLYARFALERQISFRNIITKGASHASSNVKIDVPVVMFEIYRALHRAGHHLNSVAAFGKKSKNASQVQTAEEML